MAKTGRKNGRQIGLFPHFRRGVSPILEIELIESQIYPSPSPENNLDLDFSLHVLYIYILVRQLILRSDLSHTNLR